MKNHFRRFGFKKQHGQGMTEYIIIVALIAVAAIGVYSYFGKTVRNQTAGIAQEISGKGGKSQIQKAQQASNQAASLANQDKKMGSYADGNGD
ncbi:Flp family type IVb pilin [Xanthomonas massiliensis]|jgi:Flp pilus assembly pilin Flp|uniref:Flp family type IVb pilin n=1 Tax=Xanthomonas massiliensis TaxID=1720302 RepID=UPI00082471DB|nr:pilus assembly protein [Xanthomonas massiliensis]